MSKHLLLINFICLVGFNAVFGQWENNSINSGGITRNYRVYISPNYSVSNPASLIIALHGLGDNMTNFSNTLKFNHIADTANIICIYPQAEYDIFVGAAWNSSAGLWGYYPNAFVDDIGFINELADAAIAEYAIDSRHIYLCGFSMGGFMTQKIALLSNSRFAAFASISGTIGNGITGIDPGRSVPIAHFHGTADSVVKYINNDYGVDADSLIGFWTGNNLCSNVPVIYKYPDLVNDGITAERFEYHSTDKSNADVFFYKLVGANHYILSTPQNDVDQALETWLFLRRYSLNITDIQESSSNPEYISVFPNPANDRIFVKSNTPYWGTDIIMSINNLQGQLVHQQVLKKELEEADLSELIRGIYIINFNDGLHSKNHKLVKQ
jgi:polyhydroxybutyrate depolymerase